MIKVNRESNGLVFIKMINGTKLYITPESNSIKYYELGRRAGMTLASLRGINLLSRKAKFAGKKNKLSKLIGDICE